MADQNSNIPPFVDPDLSPPETISPLEKPLEIKRIDDIGIGALAFNLLSAAILFALAFAIFIATGMGTKAAIVLSLIATWITVVFARNRLWTSADSRNANVYMNYLFPGKILIYLQGFHFTSWTSKKQPDVVNFQKHEVIKMSKEDGTQVTAKSADGYDVVGEMTAMFARTEGEGLGWSLKYGLDEIRKLTQAAVVSRFTDIVGRNTYESILHHKARMTKQIAETFGGEHTITAFESSLGIALRNPVLDSLSLTEESQKIWSTRAKVGTIADGVKALEKTGVSADERSKAVQAALQVATRAIHTFEGIPPGAKVVALGSDAVAVAAGKGGK